MTKIAFVPLDERPCNLEFPRQLAAMTDLEMSVPPVAILGRKKSPADTAALQDWLLHEGEQADHAIVSLDMLVYGGIVPSRLHHLTEQDTLDRLEVLRELKRVRPQLRIHAFNLIMRVPAYSSSEEEPDYYADYGRELFLYGWYRDKKEQEVLTEEEEQTYADILAKVPPEVLADFVGRRGINSFVNHQALQLAAEGIIDYLIIPLDDNSRYGFSPLEQRALAIRSEELDLLDRVAIYPGADEIGCTLFARIFCETKQYLPKVYVRYSSTRGPFCIPKYEDRSLGESIKAHLTSAGAFMADSSHGADAVLMVHSPAAGEADMAETSHAWGQRHRTYFSEVNMREFAQAMRVYLGEGRTVALADVSVCNGGDTVLLKLLARLGLLEGLSAYAGWNTSGNTLGTVIAHAIIEAYYAGAESASAGAFAQAAVSGASLPAEAAAAVSAAGIPAAASGVGEAAGVPLDSQGALTRSVDQQRSSRAFYLYRLVEDWGYQAIIRKEVTEKVLPGLGANYFSLPGVQQQVEDLIADKLRTFAEERLNGITPLRIDITNVHLPWNRMFEVGFDLALKSE
ncbi:DUF4127 family protein [Paenibacillus lutrae]|uniref:DUF4127 family protein n=1 Tax=Paenibacillus lutrae TaxID=2078573 RepID=A0A7X3FHS0_9BACL|nr:DUF4127 family protein [Paenibacillus lutrae]MVO99894.1 DUF4127 family protein [Paenibacillus lutrae]